jgi:hypothetical protein
VYPPYFITLIADDLLNDPQVVLGGRNEKGDFPIHDNTNVLLAKIIPFTFKGEIETLHSFIMNKASGY